MNVKKINKIKEKSTKKGEKQELPPPQNEKEIKKMETPDKQTPNTPLIKLLKL